MTDVDNDAIERMIWRWVLLTIVLMFGMGLWAGYALSYPEQAVRLGYSGCASCHVSPTGGGALTNYGRAAAHDMVSWAPLDDSQVLPDWVALGGDTRALAVRSPRGSREFLMQADAELAVEAVPGLWLDVSGGYYGPQRDREWRRGYALLTPLPELSLRAGRFFPAYGLAVPDHTTATRRGAGFDEGGETYNLELNAHSRWGEVVLTNTLAGDEQLTLSPRGYTARAAQPGTALRGTVYVSSHAYLGASYWAHTAAEQRLLVAGPFAAWAPARWLYLLAEADRRIVTSDAMVLPVDVTYELLGAELVRGVHLRLTHEYDAGQRYGVGLQLLPVPHTELLAQAKWQDDQWTTTLLAHWSW
jgi:hypothetical protein